MDCTFNVFFTQYITATNYVWSTRLSSIDTFVSYVVRNWCDLVAIVPFYFEVILAWSASTEPWNFQVDQEHTKVALRVVKLFRVLRVFKMTRQFPSSRLIVDTVYFSIDALLVPMFFLLVFVLIFASMLFFLEGTFSHLDSTMYRLFLCKLQ